MPTRAEVFQAIRNADAAGDSAGVRKLGEYLKTLPAEEPQSAADTPGTAENRALHEQRLARIEKELADEQAPLATIQRTADNLTEAGKDYVKAGLETTATLGSQAVATPVAGLTGLALSPASPLGIVTRVGAKALGKKIPSTADIVESTQRALTYQPRSEAGQAAVENVSKPFTWFAGKADQAGDAVANVTGSPALGAAANTAIQAVPVLLSRGTRGAFAGAAREAGAAVRTAAGGDAAVASSRAAAASAEAQSAAAATANAEKYARSIGLDWTALSGEIQGKLSSIARTAGQLEQLDPAAVKRLATLQGLKVPVPATRGQVFRDPVQLRNEGNAAATAEGAPIRDVYAAQDNALQANLDVLRGKVAGVGKTAATATTPEQAGGVIQAAARGKEASSRANYNQLYKVARETEPDARASVTPVTDLLTQNPEIQHLGWVQTWLNRAAKLAGGREGQPVPITEATMRELTDLRSQATAIARTGGKEGHYAGEVVKAIDSTMETVPEAAKAWRAANDAFKAHKTQFAEQGAVADLVDQSSRTDRATALEKTVDTITKGSLEDIRKVKRTLLTGGDESTRAAGKQAWRETRAQVIDRIKREATKGVAEKADGTPNVSVAKLKQVVDSYGPDKLNEIFGPGTAKEVYRILDAAKVVKTMPAGGVPIGSSTLQNVLAFIGRGVEKLPLGGTAVDVARGVGKVKELGANARATKQANLMPLDEAVRLAARKPVRTGVSTSRPPAVCPCPRLLPELTTNDRRSFPTGQTILRDCHRRAGCRLEGLYLRHRHQHSAHHVGGCSANLAECKSYRARCAWRGFRILEWHISSAPGGQPREHDLVGRWHHSR
jgi:hypothetical protein